MAAAPARGSRRAILYPEVRRKVPFSRQWLLILEKQNAFPRRFKLGPGTVAWFEDEVDAWLEARAAQREQQEEAASA